MKYAEAIKKALTDNGFLTSYNRFRDGVMKNGIAGSIQFSIADEAFYYSGEAIYNEETGEVGFEFKGGKHTPRRAAYLINRGLCYEIK